MILSQAPVPESAPAGGDVVITVRWADGEIVACVVNVRRPAAASLLIGKTATEVLTLVPRLFSLCGRAQQVVAAAALHAASDGAMCGLAVAPSAIRREAIGEHLWRLLLDWPALLFRPERICDAPPQKKTGNATFAHWFRRLRSQDPDEDLALALQDEIGQAVLDSLLGSVPDWERPLVLTPRFLPRLDRSLASSLLAIPSDDFVATPTWRSEPAEVGAMAQYIEHPEVQALIRAGRFLAARLMARWLALQGDIAILGGLGREKSAWQAKTVAAGGSGGLGYAWIETARGPLCHRVQLHNGRVAQYAVIAPTEWNFHPASAWVAALVGARAETPEIAENLVRLWALALDPCVPVRLILTKEN